MTEISDPLEQIDKSYWKLKDKQWVAERQANWPKFEAMLQDYKTRKGLSIIKAYYLRGKMYIKEDYRRCNTCNRPSKNRR